jgi:hypothetical protein
MDRVVLSMGVDKDTDVPMFELALHGGAVDSTTRRLYLSESELGEIVPKLSAALAVATANADRLAELPLT